MDRVALIVGLSSHALRTRKLSLFPKISRASYHPSHHTAHPLRKPTEVADPVKVHPIRDFFANYPDFEYNPEAPFLNEFKRMGRDLGWKKKEREAAEDDLRDAMVKQFNAMYGIRADALESWQLLCSALGINPAPKTIKQCHRRVIPTHVNLVDLIEAPLSGQSVQTFNSEVELSEYTKSLRKYFPRDNVNTGSLLRYLLRQIRKPHPRRRRGHGDGKSPRKATAGGTEASTLPA